MTNRVLPPTRVLAVIAPVCAAGFGVACAAALSFAVTPHKTTTLVGLAALLAAWPRDLPLTLEFQDPSWHVDEVFVTINDTTHYLWRAVDQHGNVLDILVQSRRTAVAAKRFFGQLLKGLR